jgi:hypothetical protein
VPSRGLPECVARGRSSSGRSQGHVAMRRNFSGANQPVGSGCKPAPNRRLVDATRRAPRRELPSMTITGDAPDTSATWRAGRRFRRSSSCFAVSSSRKLDRVRRAADTRSNKRP